MSHSAGEYVALHGVALSPEALYGDCIERALIGERAVAGEKGDCGIWIRLGVLADDIGTAKGEGGMVIRGDSGLVLVPVLVAYDEDLFEDVVEVEVVDSEDAVRERGGCVIGVDLSDEDASARDGFSSGACSSLGFSGHFSLKLNLELAPVAGLMRPGDKCLRKSR